MKGKNGNLIVNLREGEAVTLDGPGTILIKQLRRNKVVVMVNADSETNIELKRESKEVGPIKETAKE